MNIKSRNTILLFIVMVGTIALSQTPQILATIPTDLELHEDICVNTKIIYLHDEIEYKEKLIDGVQDSGVKNDSFTIYDKHNIKNILNFTDFKNYTIDRTYSFDLAKDPEKIVIWHEWETFNYKLDNSTASLDGSLFLPMDVNFTTLYTEDNMDELKAEIENSLVRKTFGSNVTLSNVNILSNIYDLTDLSVEYEILLNSDAEFNLSDTLYNGNISMKIECMKLLDNDSHIIAYKEYCMNATSNVDVTESIETVNIFQNSTSDLQTIILPNTGTVSENDDDDNDDDEKNKISSYSLISLGCFLFISTYLIVKRKNKEVTFY